MSGLNCSMWDPVPWPGIEPRPSAFGAWSLRELIPYWPNIVVVHWDMNGVAALYVCLLCAGHCPHVWFTNVASLGLMEDTVTNRQHLPTAFKVLHALVLPLPTWCHLPSALLFTRKLSTVPSSTASLLPNSCLPRDLCTSCSHCLESHPPSPCVIVSCLSFTSQLKCHFLRKTFPGHILSKLASASRPW